MYVLPVIGSDDPLDMSKKIRRVIEYYGAIFSAFVDPKLYFVEYKFPIPLQSF